MDVNLCSNGTTHLRDALDLSPFTDGFDPVQGVSHPCPEGQLGNRRNAGKGFSPETQRTKGKEVFRFSDLAGGVTLKGYRNIFRFDPFPVILDADKLVTATFTPENSVPL